MRREVPFSDDILVSKTDMAVMKNLQADLESKNADLVEKEAFKERMLDIRLK